MLLYIQHAAVISLRGPCSLIPRPSLRTRTQTDQEVHDNDTLISLSTGEAWERG